MNTNIIAAASALRPHAHRGLQPVRREAGDQANHSQSARGFPVAVSAPTAAAGVAEPLHLPSWADNEPGRELIARIKAERPAKRSFDNGISAWGGEEYAGRTANLLRKLYAAEFDRMLAWVGAVPFDSPEYHQRRDALLQFDKTCGPDAVMERVLGASDLVGVRPIPVAHLEAIFGGNQ